MKITDSRHTFKPFNYNWAYDFWLKSERMHWIHTESSTHEDVRDWQTKLTAQEKYFLTQVFRFFTQSDVNIGGAYIDSYLKAFPQPEVRMMLCSFAAREMTHQAAYSYLIETLGMPDSVYNEFLQYQEMRDKHDYLLESLVQDLPTQIAIFSALAEGLQLFSSFIMLLSFTKRGLMKGMGQIVSWSVADEALHVEGMLKIFHTLREESSFSFDTKFKTKIYEVTDDMVRLEDGFIDLAFGTEGIRELTKEEVKQYIRYIADRRLLQLGLDTKYKVKTNPIPWVEEMLNAPTHANFFEVAVSDYSKGSMTGNWSQVWAAK